MEPQESSSGTESIDTTTLLTERKVVRRGLIAGMAALGACLFIDEKI
jgi:hypothetical protein